MKTLILILLLANNCWSLALKPLSSMSEAEQQQTIEEAKRKLAIKKIIRKKGLFEFMQQAKQNYLQSGIDYTFQEALDANKEHLEAITHKFFRQGYAPEARHIIRSIFKKHVRDFDINTIHRIEDNIFNFGIDIEFQIEINNYSEIMSSN